MTKTYLTPEDIEAAVVEERFHVFPDTTVTVCLLTHTSGAKAIGYNYGAIDPSRQDWEMGKKEARKKALETIWELEGLKLRERLNVALTGSESILGNPYTEN